MADHIHASGAERARECPGSLQASKGRTLDIPEAKAGREFHRLVEDVLEGRSELGAIEDDDHREWVRRCMAWVPGPDFRVEHYLVVLSPEGEPWATGQADAIQLSAGDLRIWDWKFWHQLPDRESVWRQMQVYLAAALQETGAGLARAHVYFPIRDEAWDFSLERDELPDALEEIHATWKAANVDNPPLRPGAWCARCPALAGCPAALKSIARLVDATALEAVRGGRKLPTVKAVKESFLQEFENWSPARLRGAARLLPLLGPLGEALRAHIQEDLEVDPSSFPEWELAERRTPATVSDFTGLRDLASMWLDHDEWEGCRKISVARVRDLLAQKVLERQETDTKKDALKRAEGMVEPFCDRKSITYVKRRTDGR